jgi:hypothetical protein
MHVLIRRSLEGRPPVSAAPDYHAGWRDEPPGDLSGLLAAASSAVGNLAGGADLRQLADRDAAAMMGALTTLVGRLDGLRVQVAREVSERGICGLRGTRTLTAWLRADARLADDAWKIGRLAAKTPDLPRITALLSDGAISLTQAATACWQISQLPHLPVPPDTTTPPGAQPGAGGAAGPDAGAPAPSENGGVGLEPDPDDTDAEAGPRGGDDPACPDASLPGGAWQAGDGEGWAGLWRAGDVHAAADELFAAFLPSLDGAQLRQMGAHLREAADSLEHAADHSGDYARRGLRISRSLGGAGEISGRLHAEAAEQVIAAFEELGGKTGPDDRRTKAQRWADALARLTATSPDLHPAAPVPPADLDPGYDQPCHADPDTGHDHPGEGHAPRGGSDHGSEDPGHDSAFAAHGSGGGAGAVPAAYRRPRIIVSVPISTLLEWPLSPGASSGPGTPLTAEAARRLACDAEIVRLITSPDPPDASSGGPEATARLTQLLAVAIAQLPPPLATPSAVLDIGRKSPGWTPRQRDALYAQYGGRCSAPRCSGPIDVIHHIVHWLHGGKTRIINGCPFCAYHHWLVHEGGWRVQKLPDGTISLHPPPPGWRPGTIYRRGRPATE